MDVNTIQTRAQQLSAAQSLLREDRAAGLAALNQLFRGGTFPEPPPAGRYRGTMITIELASAFTPFVQWIADRWMPWKGKTFDVSQPRGDNIFSKDSYLVARLFNPLYRGFVVDRSRTYRAFAFRTFSAPGLFDPDRTVLKIDYNLEENPTLTVRRVLDELVQLESELYLGKAHIRWWWERWQTVGYFSLIPD